VAFGSLVAALIPLAVGQLAIATTLAIAGFLARAGTCPFWFRIWPRCLGWAWESTTRSSWSAASGKRFPPGTTDPQPRHHRGTSGRSYTPDFSLDGSHRISSPLDGSHQRNPFHRCGGIPGGGNECVACKYPRSGGAGAARSADRCRPVALYSEAGCASGRTHGKSLEAWGKVIVAHPWLAIFLAGAPLLLLAWQAARLDTSLPRGDWLPPGGGIGSRASHPGTNGPGRHCSIVARDCRTANGFHCANRRGVECARSSHQAARERPSLRPRDLHHHDCGEQPVFLGDLSRETRRTFLSSDGRAALLEVLPKASFPCAIRSTGCGSCGRPARQLSPECPAPRCSLEASRR
jgi:putative drug exporter of the RND superfamily